MLRRELLSLACFTPVSIALGHIITKKEKGDKNTKRDDDVFRVVDWQTLKNKTIIWDDKVYCTHCSFVNCIMQYHQDSIFTQSTFTNCKLLCKNHTPTMVNSAHKLTTSIYPSGYYSKCRKDSYAE